jgi:hypothetical protein
MPGWYNQLKDRVFGGSKPLPPPGDEAPPPPVSRVPEKSVAVAKPAPTLTSALWRLGPYIVFGVGLAMTIFAERLGSWCWLGFMLLATSPILFALRRIEDLLRELIETTKISRR